MCPWAEVKYKQRQYWFFLKFYPVSVGLVSSFSTALLAAVNLFVSSNTCSTSATQADISLSGQRCHPEQQEERTWIHSGLCAGHSRSIQARVQVGGCLPTSTSLEKLNQWFYFFHCVSYPEMVRRTAENSSAGFCPFGKREPCTTAACWISCRRSFVSCRIRRVPGLPGCAVQCRVQSEENQRFSKCLPANRRREKGQEAAVWGDPARRWGLCLSELASGAATGAAQEKFPFSAEDCARRVQFYCSLWVKLMLMFCKLKHSTV